jgi:hypothetical protein
MFLSTVTSVEIVSAAGAKNTRMKRGRAADAAPRPVDVGSREVVDVSADSDAESAKRKMQVKIVFQGSATPPSKLEIEKGKTNIKQFRGSVFGLRDAGEKITFRVGHVTIEIGQGGDLSTLFDLADKEAEVSGQSEVVANVYVAAPNGEGGMAVSTSPRAASPGVRSEVGAVAPQIGWAVGVLSVAAAAAAAAAAVVAEAANPQGGGGGLGRCATLACWSCEGSVEDCGHSRANSWRVSSIIRFSAWRRLEDLAKGSGARPRNDL